MMPDKHMKKVKDSHPSSSSLTDDVQRVINGSRSYSLDCQKQDGSWHGALYCDVTVTCQYIFLTAWLKVDIGDKREPFIRHLLRQQRADGSWAHTSDVEGTVSPSVEAYLALKMLNVPSTDPNMVAARKSIRSNGGLGACRIVTRIWLATFGLLPWASLPFSPAELILLPTCVPFNIYTFAPWARALIVPYLILMHHKPIFKLPHGQSVDLLDELWLDVGNRAISYGRPLRTLILEAEWTAFFIMLIDIIFSWLGRLGLGPVPYIRKTALDQCMHWTLDHFEATGDYNPGYPPGYIALLAIHVQGIPADDPRIQRGIAALDQRHLDSTNDELYVRTCTTPVWDTILMTQALLDSRPSSQLTQCQIPAAKQVSEALAWTQKRQYLAYPSDCSVYRPFINGGGFCIQYFDRWMVDIDDTAMAVITFLKHNPQQLNSNHVLSAVDYILGMQSKNGGWAAFEADNTNFYLQKLPFCDYVYLLCDPPVPDVTGHALEALGLVMMLSQQSSNSKDVQSAASLTPERFARVQSACARAMDYLATEMEVNGSWFGRWQCNYVFGTSAVLCGLEHFTHGPHANRKAQLMVAKGIDFLRSWQNEDGGHGEATTSYFWKPSAPDAEATRPVRDSTISQTAWAIMGLIAHLPAKDESVRRGVEYLVRLYVSRPASTMCRGHNSQISEIQPTAQLAQVVPGTWTEDFFSGGSIPGWMSLKYEYYPHYFPLMALGRYMRKVEAEKIK